MCTNSALRQKCTLFFHLLVPRSSSQHSPEPRPRPATSCNHGNTEPPVAFMTQELQHLVCSNLLNDWIGESNLLTGWVGEVKSSFAKSRKLASASWSPSYFSKVLRGWNLPAFGSMKLQAVWPWLIPPEDTVGMSPPAANSAAPTSSASLCFHAKLPAKLAFAPYPWASSMYADCSEVSPLLFLWKWINIFNIFLTVNIRIGHIEYINNNYIIL